MRHPGQKGEFNVDTEFKRKKKLPPPVVRNQLWVC